MILHDYVRLLRRGRWVIALMALLGAGAGALLAYTTAPTYYAQATVYVAVAGNATPADLQQGNVFAVQRAATYAHLAQTRAVLDRAADVLDDTSAEALRSSVTASARADAAVIDIVASGNVPSEVADRANAVAGVLARQAALLDAPDPNSPVQLRVVESADTPEIAASPRPRNDVLIGLLAGLLVGVVAVVAADALNTRIRSLADLPLSPALATVTSIPAGGTRRPHAAPRIDSRVESIRNLRANLQFGSHAGRVLAVAGVTSASDAREIARQLAAAFAEIGSVVVTVEADLRPAEISRHRPQVRDEDDGVVGLSDVLQGRTSVDEAVSRSGENTFVMSAGAVDGNPSQRLSTRAMMETLERLTARFDYIFLVSPPIVDRSEAVVAAALADSCLIVVESGVTKLAEFTYALELLSGVGVRSVNVAVDHVHSGDLAHASRPEIAESGNTG